MQRGTQPRVAAWATHEEHIRMRRLLTWAVVLLLATSGVATAQENTTGSISGTITDSTGGILPPG